MAPPSRAAFAAALWLLPCAAWINPGTPNGVPPSFDCEVRKLAWEYSKLLRPDKQNFRSVFEALQLQNCNMSTPKAPDTWQPSAKSDDTLQHCFDANSPSFRVFVDARNGHDEKNTGSIQDPLLTIRAAVDAARGKGTKDHPACIILRDGHHEVLETIHVTSDLSYTRIVGFPGESPVIGGQTLNITQWESYKIEKRIDLMPGLNNVYKRAVSRDDTDTIKYIGTFSNYSACAIASLASFKGPFTSIVYHGASLDEFRGQCFGVTDGYWKPEAQSNVSTGVVVSQNVWRTHVPGVARIPGLRKNGRRAIRAKFPNGNPELSGEWLEGAEPGMGGGDYVRGWNPLAMKNEWMPPRPPASPAEEIVITADDWPGVDWPMTQEGGSTWTGEGDWGEFHMGLGGTCQNDVNPPMGYWCANNPPRQITSHMSPDGLVWERALKYSNASTGVIQAWRGGGRWYTWQFQITGFVRANSTLLFDPKTGGQGGEGVPFGGQWWIENILEECDDHDEWFFDEKTRMLYYQPNATFGHGPDLNDNFTATGAEIFFDIRGTMENPVKGFHISNVTIRDASLSYLEPHGLPSGGDWALQRSGAIRLEGVEDATIQGNLFTDLDGIGVSMNGYCNNTLLSRNEFLRIGASAMTAWGFTSECLNKNCTKKTPYKMGPDGRGKEQPRFTTVSENIVREIGIWQKQSSFWFQAVTAQTHLVANIHFNGPRAGMNFNDGFGGGDLIEKNLVFNCVRESGDHGPWNSWDRVPYITNIRTGQPSIRPQWREIRNNFILSVYASQEAIDTDDGSSYYHTHDNFFAYASNGLKSDFGGQYNHHTNNVYAYVAGCYMVGNNDWFLDNTCVVTSEAEGFLSDCKAPSTMRVGNNTLYNKEGKFSVKICNKTNTVAAWPSDVQLISWGKMKLQMN